MTSKKKAHWPNKRNANDKSCDAHKDGVLTLMDTKTHNKMIVYNHLAVSTLSAPISWNADSNHSPRTTSITANTPADEPLR